MDWPMAMTTWKKAANSSWCVCTALLQSSLHSPPSFVTPWVTKVEQVTEVGRLIWSTVLSSLSYGARLSSLPSLNPNRGWARRSQNMPQAAARLLRPVTNRRWEWFGTTRRVSDFGPIGCYLLLKDVIGPLPKRQCFGRTSDVYVKGWIKVIFGLDICANDFCFSLAQLLTT